jgi:hypothetical protein
LCIILTKCSQDFSVYCYIHWLLTCLVLIYRNNIL